MTLPNVRFRTTVRLAVLGVAATLSLALAETPAAVRKVTLVLASDVACTVKLDGEKVSPPIPRADRGPRQGRGRLHDPLQAGQGAA
jgi:hypothetical protein